MVKSARFLLALPPSTEGVLTYSQMLATILNTDIRSCYRDSFTSISFTLTLMEPEVRFELTKLARRLTKPFQLTAMGLRLI